MEVAIGEYGTDMGVLAEVVKTSRNDKEKRLKDKGNYSSKLPSSKFIYDEYKAAFENEPNNWA